MNIAIKNAQRKAYTVLTQHLNVHPLLKIVTYTVHLLVSKGTLTFPRLHQGGLGQGVVIMAVAVMAVVMVQQRHTTILALVAGREGRGGRGEGDADPVGALLQVGGGGEEAVARPRGVGRLAPRGGGRGGEGGGEGAVGLLAGAGGGGRLRLVLMTLERFVLMLLLLLFYGGGDGGGEAELRGQVEDGGGGGERRRVEEGGGGGGVVEPVLYSLHHGVHDGPGGM